MVIVSSDFHHSAPNYGVGSRPRSTCKGTEFRLCPNVEWGAFLDSRGRRDDPWSRESFCHVVRTSSRAATTSSQVMRGRFTPPRPVSPIFHSGLYLAVVRSPWCESPCIHRSSLCPQRAHQAVAEDEIKTLVTAGWKRVIGAPGKKRQGSSNMLVAGKVGGLRWNPPTSTGDHCPPGEVHWRPANIDERQRPSLAILEGQRVTLLPEFSEKRDMYASVSYPGPGLDWSVFPW